MAQPCHTENLCAARLGKAVLAEPNIIDTGGKRLSIPLGSNIKKLRLATGMTQRQLAYQLRISVQAVSKWERGLTYPDVTLLVPIAELFCVTLDELFGRSAAEE